ncbi:MAG: hypothetical protein NT007_04070 [Candidatus Kapabacteria bacterium]|nr:hypothetical protein [Candidatus Kapabacteria bacterium]
MQRKFILFVFSIIILSSCELLGPNDCNPEVYFPMKFGNYWVYKCTAIDSSGNTTGAVFTDSVVIDEIKIIKGITNYRISRFRSSDTVIRSYFCISNNQILSGNWYIEPLTDVFGKSDMDCVCMDSIRYYNFYSCGLNSINLTDSLTADTMRFVGHPPFSYTLVQYNFDYSWRLTGNVNWNNSIFNFNCQSFRIQETNVWKLIKPDNAAFKKDPKYIYFDDRTLLRNQFTFDYYLAPEVGMVYSQYVENKYFNRGVRRELIRYKVY